MSVEFKIIGDLTLKQFFFLLIFAGLAYASFMLIDVFVIKWFLVVVLAGTGLCFAFLPLGDRGLDQWIVNFIKAMYMSNQYVYRKEEEIPNVFLYQNLDVLRNELITLTPTTSRRKIEAYLEQQTQPIDKLDIDEKSYILKVREAYSNMPSASYTQSESPVYNTPYVSTTVAEPEPTLQIQDNGGYPNPEEDKQKEIHVEEVKQDLSLPELPAPQMEVNTVNKPITVELPKPKQTTSEPKPIETPKQPEIIKHKPHYTQRSRDDNEYSPSITPDMHSGRKFINLAPEMGRGEIVLPIRGEMVIAPLDNEKLRQDDEQKAKRLDSLLQELKNNEQIQKRVLEAQQLEQNQNIQKQNESELTNRLKREEELKQEQERLDQMKKEEEEIIKQKKEMERKKSEDEERIRKEKEFETQIALTALPAQQTQNPTSPNVIWGVVINENNNKEPVEDVVVVIRNARKEVVRALKTGRQGRFAITNPLINGTYYIDTDKEGRSGLNFAPVVIEAKGEIIPTIEISGKSKDKL